AEMLIPGEQEGRAAKITHDLSQLSWCLPVPVLIDHGQEAGQIDGALVDDGRLLVVGWFDLDRAGHLVKDGKVGLSMGCQGTLTSLERYEVRWVNGQRCDWLVRVMTQRVLREVSLTARPADKGAWANVVEVRR